MTVASDLCRCGGAPLKIPPILGVQRIFLKYYRKRTPLALGYTRPYMTPRCYFHSDIPPGPSKTKESALKKPLHPCLTLTPYGNLTNHGTDTIRTSTSYGTGAVIITSELRYEGRSNNERNYSPNNEPALLPGRVSTTERARARLAAVSTSWLSWAGAGGLRPMMKKKHPGNKAHMGTWPGLLAH